MPGSLLGLGALVRRNDSTRSDRSDFSGHSTDSRASKKVSFNKAVRVKKYPLLSEEYNENDVEGDPMTPTTSRRFWFKVYQNHNDSEEAWNDPSELNGSDKLKKEENEGKLTPIAEDSDLSSDLHSSQLPAQTPSVNKNHVKNIVTKFNKELTKLRKKWEESPEEINANGLINSTVNYPNRDLDVLSQNSPKVTETSTKRDESNLSSRQRSINNSQVKDKNANNIKKSTMNYASGRAMNGYKSYNNSQVSNLKAGGQTDQSLDKRKVTTLRIGINDRNSSKPCSRYNAIKAENKQPENYLKRNTTRKAVNCSKPAHNESAKIASQSERSPINQRIHGQSFDCKRRSKSHDETVKSPPRSCLRRFDKSISTDALNSRTPLRQSTKHSVRNGNDKGVQCNGTLPSSQRDTLLSSQRDISFHLPKSSKLILQVNGANRANRSGQVNSFSTLHSTPSKSEMKDPFISLPSQYETNDQKRGRDPLKIEKDPVVSMIANHILDYHTRSQRDNFSDKSSSNSPKELGLNTHLQSDILNSGLQNTTSKEDKDFGLTRNNNYASFRSQNNPNKFLYIQDNRNSSDIKENTPASVIREMDFKKREISYENVPREGKDTSHKRIIQGNINQGSPVAKRKDFSFKDHSFTLPIPGRKSEKHRGSKNHKSKSSKLDDDDKLSQCYDAGDYTSFQDDTLYCRRSSSVPRQAPSDTKSSATTMLLRRYRDSSTEGRKDFSPMSCSDSEAVVRRRKTLVMYIPGISHHNRPAEDDDRMSSISTAWSQASDHRRIHRGKDKEPEDNYAPIQQRRSDEFSDIYRRHSMSKDTKLQWLNWKAKGKFSREP